MASSDGGKFHKPLTNIPSKFRTQAQTSSSSGSLPAEPKSHSSSVYYIHAPEQEEISGSQELFSSSKVTGDNNSPECYIPPATSTPFVNVRNKECNSLQLSGESICSQPSYLYAHSKPELSTSPTALRKFTLTSSSNSGDERKKLCREKEPPEKEDTEQTIDVPAWCEHYDAQLDESVKSHAGETGNSSNDDVAERSNTTDTSLIPQNSERENVELLVPVTTDCRLVMSGTDIFNPLDSQLAGASRNTCTNEMEIEESQPMSAMNFELSQDFSQVN